MSFKAVVLKMVREDLPTAGGHEPGIGKISARHGIENDSWRHES